MKAAILLAVVLSLPILQADDAPSKFPVLTTLTGKTFNNVTVTKRTPVSIGIMHESGTATIALTDLPEDLRNQFGYDPEAAKAMAAQQAVAAEAAKKVEEAKKKQAEAKKAADALWNSAHNQEFVVEQILDDGVLAHMRYQDRSTLFYLVGVPNKGKLVDHDLIAGCFAAQGNYKYGPETFTRMVYEGPTRSTAKPQKQADYTSPLDQKAHRL